MELDECVRFLVKSYVRPQIITKVPHAVQTLCSAHVYIRYI